jgi:hypothetical protein
LAAGDDELAEWAQQKNDSFFLKPTAVNFQNSTGVVSNWAQTQNYEQGAIDEFLKAADYWLVVQAHTGKFDVVTHEVPANSPKKIKIPDACIAMKINFLSPYVMLRKEKARFILESNSLINDQITD